MTLRKRATKNPPRVLLFGGFIKRRKEFFLLIWKSVYIIHIKRRLKLD
jgi:hypothetical protein